MAVAPAREQALPLLAAANNHGDLAVKISSLKQAKDFLLSVEPSHAADFYPFLLELQFSPETLVRKYLIELDFAQEVNVASDEFRVALDKPLAVMCMLIPAITNTLCGYKCLVSNPDSDRRTAPCNVPRVIRISGSGPNEHIKRFM